MMRQAAYQCAALWPLLWVLAGCGTGDPWDRQALYGAVSLDGQPVATGSIRFEPSDPATGQTAGAVIQNGSYAIPGEQGLPTGTYRVSISAVDPPTQAPSMDAALLPEEKIPARYNRESELTVEVVAGEANPFNFDLETSSP